MARYDTLSSELPNPERPSPEPQTVGAQGISAEQVDVGEDPLWEDEPVLSRRERMRQARQAAHAAPARFSLRLSAVIVVVAAVVTWLVVSWLSGAHRAGEELPDPPEPQAAGADSDAGSGDTASGDDSPGDGGEADQARQGEMDANLMVHVAGAVEDPQVVELEPGARVLDAVEAAGGLTEDAAAEAVNLAAEAEDGTLIWVPTQEEAEAGMSPPQAADTAADADGDGQKVNINTADAAELETLPGIGPALAERIITHRQTHGEFGSVEELEAVSGIGPAVLENIADLVTW
ncbi:helix-hairpin-helix domain-containing protein [Nesterenkonia alba]|uniref:helix-hairpin-helix domain-containing protein n=1 Tax=Nesterenkonia alba TaxID=515814 RepID=UPI0003B69544|nr:helix-hairpin-helix domain-containing protein [Nesterenkonia alba]